MPKPTIAEGPITLERLQTGGDKEKFPFEYLEGDGANLVQLQTGPAHFQIFNAEVRVSRRAHNWKLTRRDIYFLVPCQDDPEGELWHGVLFGEGTRFLAKPLGRAQRRREASLARRRALKAAGLVPCARCNTPTDPTLLDVVSYCPACSEIVRDPE